MPRSSSLLFHRVSETCELLETRLRSISSNDLSHGSVSLIIRNHADSAIYPVIDNLNGFDLNKTEAAIFNKFLGHSWYVGLVSNSGVQDNVTLINYGTNNTDNFNIPIVPGVYNLYATVVPSIHYFLFAGNDSQPTFTKSQVKTALQDTLTRLRATGVIPESSGPAKDLDIIDYSNHSPYELYVPSDQIAKGFYNKLFALQGQRNTYWTGAAFVTHSSAAIWNYTDQLVTKIWSGGDRPVNIVSMR